MRVHYLQHAPFEGLGSLRDALKKRDCKLSSTKFFQNPELPPDDSFDWLIIMGGPMGVYDTDRFPWLEEEQAFIRRAIINGKTVLGICLGAQLIAASLGATVHSLGVKEIGWFPITPTPEAAETPFRSIFQTRFHVFHWHGDTFDLPEGATRLATSEVCDNQAFILGDRVMGLQFHMETTQISASALINHCGHELKSSGRFVQTADEMMAITNRFTHINLTMDSLIDRLYRQTESEKTA